MDTWHNPSPPEEYKRWTVVEYALKGGIDTLVETGTQMGGMVEYTRGFFKDVYSIELYERFFEHGRQMFAACPNVHLFHGDSAEVLPCILHGLDGPAVFWLDAHWQGDVLLPRGPVNTAIQGETEALVKWGGDGIVLIDDIRYFGQLEGWPPVEGIRGQLLSAHPDWAFYVQDDIARAHRPF